MPTLLETLVHRDETGAQLFDDENVTPGNALKNPVEWCAALIEWSLGYITQAEFLSMFPIDPSHSTHALLLKSLADAAPEKARFGDALRRWLRLGLHGYDPGDGRYWDIAAYNTRLRDEITDQGGTPP